jgi:chaperone BCS1
VKHFLGRKQWYAKRGIPWRRGYLLHGPPGSGKTSYIQALAGSLGYDIYLINLSLRGLADDKLTLLLSQAPPRSLILIEDVDAAFNKRVQMTEDG